MLEGKTIYVPISTQGSGNVNASKDINLSVVLDIFIRSKHQNTYGCVR